MPTKQAGAVQLKRREARHPREMTLVTNSMLAKIPKRRMVVPEL